MATQPDATEMRRAPLSRERVLRTAIALADAGGIESLSMRRLGQELGVEAMSLYNHVANKEDLLEAIVDIVVGEIWVPSKGDEWKPAMRRRAISMREMLQRHPWANGLLEASASPSPARLRYPEAVVACLRDAGFSVAMAVHAFNTLDSYIYGFALQERSLPFQSPAEMESVAGEMELPADEFPYLSEVVRELLASGFTYADEFEFGLDLILGGLERSRHAPTRRRRTRRRGRTPRS
jgi:AcrR family transcriptional regulator